MSLVSLVQEHIMNVGLNYTEAGGFALEQVLHVVAIAVFI
jgi:hypothetical protein